MHACVLRCTAMLLCARRRIRGRHVLHCGAQCDVVREDDACSCVAAHCRVRSEGALLHSVHWCATGPHGWLAKGSVLWRFPFRVAYNPVNAVVCATPEADELHVSAPPPILLNTVPCDSTKRERGVWNEEGYEAGRPRHG